MQNHFRGLPGMHILNYRLLVHIQQSQLRFLPNTERICPSVLYELLLLEKN